LSVTNKLETVDSFVICYILILVLGFAALFGLIALSFDAATTVITDIGKYERVLKLTGYPKNKLTKYFPDKIPDNAKNIVFSYNYAFLQGGENFNLKFKTDSDYIEDYIYILSRKVKWTVNDSEVVKKNILSGGFYVFSYPDLPEDFTIYVIYSKPYHPGDFNHGELSLAVVSKKRNEIIFLAEDW
jgi:hypothetical protein